MVFGMASQLRVWPNLSLHSQRTAPLTPVSCRFYPPHQSLSCFPGNASQVSDGAAAVLLARRSVAKRLGLPIVGKYVAAATIGVPPRIMGVGPAYAIPRVLELTGLSLNDIDFF